MAVEHQVAVVGGETLAQLRVAAHSDDLTRDVAARHGDYGGGLLERLERVGVVGAVLQPALVAMLATWALAEDRRRVRLGSPPAPPEFRPRFHRFLAERL